MDMNRFLVAAIAVAAAPGAFAVEYLSVEAAQKMMFTDATSFADQAVTLTPEQWRDIDARTHTAAHARAPQVFRALRDGRTLGWFYLDDVIGKTELITYAVSIGVDGRVRQVEILNYRESHGFEVRNPRWRQQFAGKGVDSPVALGEDIANISGATLSCRHLTEGVRRIVALHALNAARVAS